MVGNYRPGGSLNDYYNQAYQLAMMKQRQQQAITASMISGGSGIRNSTLIEVPDMQTLTENFHKRLNLSEADKRSPKVNEVIQGLVKVFQDGTVHPESAAPVRFAELFERVRNLPRTPEGDMILPPEIMSEFTVEKIRSW